MRDKAATRKSKLNIFLAVLMVVFAMAAITIYAAPELLFKVYGNEDDFEERVNQKFSSMTALPDGDTRAISYDYSSSAAIATRYDTTTNEDLAVFRDQRIREIRDNFTERIEKEESSREEEEGNDFLYRPLQHVLLIDTAVYDSGTGAYTLAIYTEEYSEDSDMKMEKVNSSVDTWLMAKDDIRAINPVQVMTPGYRDRAADLVNASLKSKYEEDQYAIGYTSFLNSTDDNYNKFVISPSTVTFFFDPGTVMKDEEGVVAVRLDRKDMGATVRARMVDRFVDPSRPMVALTYDDGPGGKTEQRILNCLKKYNSVATFFYIGNSVGNDPATVKMAYDMGCEIGNHSWNHADLTTLSKEDYMKQINKTNKAVSKVTGVNPTVFRPPYGAVNKDIIKDVGLPTILWDVDTLDWKLRDEEKLYKKFVKNRKLNGKIVLLHSIHDETADASEKIIPLLVKRGYQLVTVSELIKYRSGESPKAGESY